MTEKRPLTAVRVLIVEDHEYTRDLLNMVLQTTGADIKLATDGMSALEITRDHDFDAILADLEMSPLNGESFARHLIAGDSRYDGRLVAVTAHADRDRIQSAMAVFTDYLVKPVHPERLTRTILQVLESRGTICARQPA